MTEGPEFLYEFGPFALDSRERVLLREGQPVPLAPKAVDILLVLVRNSGHLVEKNRLMSEVWPSTYVEEANLTQNISILRKVLSEGGKVSNYIETVPRRGYRFLVSVRKISGTARGLSELDSGVRNYRLLAILPFVNASGDERMDYLSAGITESIINSISQLQQLRVMSRNAVFRYREKEIDAQTIGRELQVDAVLVGQVQLVGRRLQVSAELVDVANGWQLWGDTYDRSAKAILEVQEEIARQIYTTLRLRLTGEDERRLTQRFTESGEAYQAYLQARYHWSKFTREGLQQATIFFRQAIELDSNYALAYAGIVDCYLRLATNYIPPTEAQPVVIPSEKGDGFSAESVEPPEPVKTRYKWDWTGVERELKRAAELRSNYPAAHQWQAAYLYAYNLFRESLGTARDVGQGEDKPDDDFLNEKKMSTQISIQTPTAAEEVQIFCAVAREQIEAGNYEGGCQILKNWWTVGEWPKLNNLSSYAAGDLLFTAGALTGWIASSRQVAGGQKHAQGLLSGAVGIFEQLGLKARSAEAKIELGYCYYREGLFDLARDTLAASMTGLNEEDPELETLALIRLAIVERHAGRLHLALSWLRKAETLAQLIGPWATGRHNLECATTLKNLANVESQIHYSVDALGYYKKALYEFDAIGNHRYLAVGENNLGYLFLNLKKFHEAGIHLNRARNLFESLGDKVCCAQVDETLARLYISQGRFELAKINIMRAIDTLRVGDEEVLLSEALITQGLILCRLKLYHEAKIVLDRGTQLAIRCRDAESVGRALIVSAEEMFAQLDETERRELITEIEKFLIGSEQTAIKTQLAKCLARITVRST